MLIIRISSCSLHSPHAIDHLLRPPPPLTGVARWSQLGAELEARRLALEDAVHQASLARAEADRARMDTERVQLELDRTREQLGQCQDENGKLRDENRDLLRQLDEIADLQARSVSLCVICVLCSLRRPPFCLTRLSCVPR